MAALGHYGCKGNQKQTLMVMWVSRTSSHWYFSLLQQVRIYNGHRPTSTSWPHVFSPILPWQYATILERWGDARDGRRRGRAAGYRTCQRADDSTTPRYSDPRKVHLRLRPLEPRQEDRTYDFFCFWLRDLLTVTPHGPAGANSPGIQVHFHHMIGCATGAYLVEQNRRTAMVLLYRQAVGLDPMDRRSG